MLCILCSENSAFKLILPCLHVVCNDCLHTFLGCNNTPHFIFSCPECDLKIQIPKEGVSAFKRCIPQLDLALPPGPGVGDGQENGNIQLNGNGSINCCPLNTDGNAYILSQITDTDTVRKFNNDVNNVVKGGTVVGDCVGTPGNGTDGNSYRNSNPNSDEIHTSNTKYKHDVSVAKLTNVENVNKVCQASDNKSSIGNRIAFSVTESCCPHVLSKHHTPVRDVDFYCAQCDTIICEDCVADSHADHKCTEMSQTIKNKKEYLNELLAQVKANSSKCDDYLDHIKKFRLHLDATKEKLHIQIQERAKNLCTMIENRKTILLAELDSICHVNTDKYTEQENVINNRLCKFNDACQFASDVIKNSSNIEFINLHNEMTSRLLNLVHQAQTSTEQLQLLNLRIAIPEKDKEESHLDRLFGGLMQGNINFTDTELVTSFDIELNWPMGLQVTRNQDYVIVGKDGAFESSGRVLFYNRQAQLQMSHKLEEKQLPCDVMCLDDGAVLVSDNRGQITKYSPKGIVLTTWQNMFKGIGRMTSCGHNDFLVTSSEDRCIFKYNSDAQLLSTVPSPDCRVKLQEPHYVATNENNDIIVSDFKLNAIFVFDVNGDFIMEYGNDEAPMKCLSALCCDPFNNMLVADFPNDQVSLVSKSGQFLGYLLTKENGIACPNFVSLDHDGHLFVGQYGGEIKVFRYLSYVKNV